MNARSLPTTRPAIVAGTGRACRLAERGLRSGRFPHAVAGAEMIARDGVEVGAGDADNPGLVGMRGRMDDARSASAGLAGADAVALGRFEHGAILGLRIDAPPLGHFRDGAGIAVDRP